MARIRGIKATNLANSWRYARPKLQPKQTKAIAFPTDARLLHKARVALVRRARKAGIELRQSYERVGNEALQEHFERLLQVTRRIHSQPRKRAEGDPPKLYSMHVPETECIAKGKAHKPYEFGVKVGIVSTCCTTMNLKVWIAGAKRGVTAAIHRKLKRRNAVEPVIGHMKSDGRLARNFLKGVEGDAINALLCGAGHNLRKILKTLRLLCAQWGISMKRLLSVCHIDLAAFKSLAA